MGRKIAIIGMSQASRHNAPWGDETWELWGLNESYAYEIKDPPFWPRFEEYCSRGRVVWFQMHPRYDYSRPDNHNDPIHWEWLQNKTWNRTTIRRRRKMIVANAKGSPPQTIIDRDWKQGEPMRPINFPIYMMQQEADIPGSIEYPYGEIIDTFMLNHLRVISYLPIVEMKTDEYNTSTMAHMIALAALLAKRGEVETIGLWGIDAASDTEYAYQKGSIEFWIGKAGEYAPLLIDDKSSLLKGLVYGYEGVTTLSKEWYAKRLAFLKPKHAEALKAYQDLDSEMSMEAATIEPVNKEEHQVKYLSAIGDLMTYWGAVQYCERQIKTLDRREKKGEASPGMIRQVIELEHNQMQRDIDVELGKLNRSTKEHETRLQEWLRETKPGAKDSKLHHAEKAWSAMVEQMSKVSVGFGMLQEMKYEMAIMDMREVSPDLVHRITPKVGRNDG